MPILPFPLPGRILSLVGGGGKTTLMYALAMESARNGLRVLVTTSTRIYMPQGQYYTANAREAEALWQRGSFAVIGTPVLSGTKLALPEASLWRELSAQADVVLIEADGARHHPIKFPRSGEPVILPQSDAVLAVMGLSAIGMPWKQACFGLQEEKNGTLTEADAASILTSTAGSRKDVGMRPYAVALNQADTPQRQASGTKLAALLHAQGISQVALTAFSEAEQAFFQSIAKGKNL